MANAIVPRAPTRIPFSHFPRLDEKKSTEKKLVLAERRDAFEVRDALLGPEARPAAKAPKAAPKGQAPTWLVGLGHMWR